MRKARPIRIIPTHRCRLFRPLLTVDPETLSEVVDEAGGRQLVLMLEGQEGGAVTSDWRQKIPSGTVPRRVCTSSRTTA